MRCCLFLCYCCLSFPCLPHLGEPFLLLTLFLFYREVRLEEGCCLVVWFVVFGGICEGNLCSFCLFFKFFFSYLPLVLQSRTGLVSTGSVDRGGGDCGARFPVSTCVLALLLFFSFLVLVLVLCSVCVGLGFGPGPSLVFYLWPSVFSLHCLASCAALVLRSLVVLRCFFHVAVLFPCCGAFSMLRCFFPCCGAFSMLPYWLFPCCVAFSHVAVPLAMLRCL